MAKTFANVNLIGSYNTIMAELTIDGHVENIQFFEDDFVIVFDAANAGSFQPAVVAAHAMHDFQICGVDDFYFFVLVRKKCFNLFRAIARFQRIQN